MKYAVLGLLVMGVTIVGISQDVFKEKETPESSILGSLMDKPSKDQILGEILEGVLENYHITKKELNDSISKNALDLYIERVDYGKQFLTQKDVKDISKYKNDFDNQMREGKLKIVDALERIMKKRVPMIQKHVEATLKKKFTFEEKEEYETDAKKREFVKNEKELKDRWEKLVKLEILLQYFALKDIQDGISTDKKKKKNKKKKIVKVKEKKLNHQELMTKAKDKISERYKRVFKRLLDERRSDQLDKFYNSIARVYDPHTHYYVPEEKEDFDIDMSGQLEGIGALLREEGSYIKVEKIIPGSASWRGKELQPEDIILAVSQDGKDFVDIVDMALRDAVKMIRGKKGTKVFLKVKKPDGVTEIIEITRDKVVLEESYVKGAIIKHKALNKKIGYINVPKFYRDFQNPKGRNCSTDVKNELIKMNKSNVDVVVLDLRNNGGGALVDATLMGGLFIDKGPIVQTRRTGVPDVKYDVDGKTYWDKPLVVLINGQSASASEIVAGAMKDYKRGIVIGSSEQTHGKGTVQQIIDLDGFLASNNRMSKIGKIGAMKITTEMFYRVNGMSTQFRGVVPDIELPDQFGFLDIGEKTLDYAIPYQEVKPAKYKVWTKHSYDIKDLVEKSKKRIAANKNFQQVIKSVEWSKERKDKTVRSLNLTEMKEYREMLQKVSDSYDEFEANKLITIKSTKKQKNDVEKESFKEFQESLLKDPVVEETIFVIKDMLKL